MHPVDRRKYHRKLLVVVKMPTNLLASCSFLLLGIFCLDLVLKILKHLNLKLLN